MAAQRRYPDELRERAVKMVFEIRERDGKGTGNWPGLSPATARNWWESVRTMSVSMCASPVSLLAPDTPWRSRYREACSGFTP
jgi:hypothetical protein